MSRTGRTELHKKRGDAVCTSHLMLFRMDDLEDCSGIFSLAPVPLPLDADVNKENKLSTREADEALELLASEVEKQRHEETSSKKRRDVAVDDTCRSVPRHSFKHPQRGITGMLVLPASAF
jgi:hypothetical protein